MLSIWLIALSLASKSCCSAISVISVVKNTIESIRDFILGWPEIGKVVWYVWEVWLIVVSLLPDEVALVCGVEIRAKPMRLDDVGIC